MFLLTRNELAYLTPLFQQANPLGLFTATAEVAGGNEAESLTEKGVLQNGSPSTLAAVIFAIAANPDVVARVALYNGALTLEKYVYRQGSGFALLEAAEEGLHLSAPNNWDAAVGEYAQFIGSSATQSTLLNFDMGMEEATTFFALFDIERMRALNALLGHVEDAPGASAKAIAAAVVNPVEGSLVSLLTGNGLPSSVKTEAALASLAEKGILETEDGSYSLTEEALTLARRFVAVQTGITLDLLQPTADSIANATTIVLSASPIDAIAVSLTCDGVGVVSLSAASILAMLEETFACPEILAS